MDGSQRFLGIYEYQWYETNFVQINVYAVWVRYHETDGFNAEFLMFHEKTGCFPIVLFTYLIKGLINDAVSNSDNIASNDRMICA
jgi:hypothetical protein